MNIDLENEYQGNILPISKIIGDNTQKRTSDTGEIPIDQLRLMSGRDIRGDQTEGILNRGKEKKKRRKFYIIAAEDEIEHISLDEIR